MILTNNVPHNQWIKYWCCL